jgi:DNA-binding transcriptional LysR family regulator
MPELRTINLNLLLALDALLEEGSVTRAARRIGLTQSAMSHNLAALRQLFDDPLLVRTPEGMQPTTRAVALQEPLGYLLRDLEHLINQEPAFEPSTSTRTLTIATADFVAVRLVPDLLESLVHAAPGIDLKVRPLPIPNLGAALRMGEVDLVIAPRPPEDQELASTLLLEEPWACAVRSGHPILANPLNAENYAALEHVMVSPTGHGASAVDAALEALDLDRRVRCRVHSFLSAPFLLLSSDLVLTAPRSQLERVQALGLTVLNLPFELPPLKLYAVWHRRFEHAAHHRWIRTMLEGAVAKRSDI